MRYVIQKIWSFIFLLIGVYSCTESSEKRVAFLDEGLNSTVRIHISSDGKLAYFNDSSSLVVYDLISQEKKVYSKIKSNGFNYNFSDQTIALIDRKTKTYNVYGYTGILLVNQTFGVDSLFGPTAYFLESNLIIKVDSGSFIYKHNTQDKQFYPVVIKGFFQDDGLDYVLSYDSIHVFNKATESISHKSYFCDIGFYEKYRVYKVKNNLIVISEIDSKTSRIVSFNIETKAAKVLGEFDDLNRAEDSFVSYDTNDCLIIGVGNQVFLINNDLSLLMKAKHPIENVYQYEGRIFIVTLDEVFMIGPKKTVSSYIKDVNEPFSNTVFYKNKMYYPYHGKVNEISLAKRE